jgi:hypothetical protein
VIPEWNLLYGFPGEDPSEYDQMADLIGSLIHLTPPVAEDRCGLIASARITKIPREWV